MLWRARNGGFIIWVEPEDCGFQQVAGRKSRSWGLYRLSRDSKPEGLSFYLGGG